MKKYLFLNLLLNLIKNSINKRSHILFCLVIMLTVLRASGQTTTDINYLNDSNYLSTVPNPCNIFQSNRTIGGVVNQAWAGGLDYTKKKGIFLPTTPTNLGGTAYLLLYTFSPSKAYTISITTNGGDNNIDLHTCTAADGTEVINAFPTSGPPACGTDVKVGGYTPRNYAISSGAVGSASHTITIPAFIPNTLQQYLIIWATNGLLQADGFYISDISIVATSLSFNISPASLSTITCGSAISQTFTAVNNTNYPGVTGYTWNLGPTPNNWYYQGSPAPPTVTLPGSTISLTVPGCSPTPTTQLSVRANLSGGNSVPALNTVGVSMNPIQLVGPASMCGQPTLYYISNLSCPSASVNWSANPSGDVSFSCTTCTQTTLTKLVNGSNITLTANLSGACSTSPYNLSQPVSVDAPNNLTGTYSTNTNTYPLQTVNFVQGGTINGQYNWGSVTNQTLAHSGSASWSYGGNGTFGFYITTGQNMNLNFSGTSATCGAVTATRTFLQSSFGNLVVTASPVPSNGILNVSLDQVPDTTITFEKAQTLSSTTFKKETKISILDVNTGNLIKQWIYQENESANYNLNISGYKAGIYILKVERNNRTVNTKIILQ